VLPGRGRRGPALVERGANALIGHPAGGGVARVTLQKKKRKRKQITHIYIQI